MEERAQARESTAQSWGKERVGSLGCCEENPTWSSSHAPRGQLSPEDLLASNIPYSLIQERDRESPKNEALAFTLRTL